MISFYFSMKQEALKALLISVIESTHEQNLLDEFKAVFDRHAKEHQRISIEQYNEELEKAIEQGNNGEIISHTEVVCKYKLL